LRKVLASLPNWDCMSDARQVAAFGAVIDAFAELDLAVSDHAGAPRLATVRMHLSRFNKAVQEALAVVSQFDPRTATLLKEVAGQSELRDYESQGPAFPHETFARGHRRVEILTRTLREFEQWGSETVAGLPTQDTRSDPPGIARFVERMADMWTQVCDSKFNASRNNGGAPDLIYRLLVAGQFECTRAAVLRAAQIVVQDRSPN